MEQELIMENKKQEYTIVKYVKARIKNNKNFICSITGPTGSGKSWSGLSFAEMVDEDFKIDQVIFRAADLMNLINSGKLKAGSVIVWDEAGIDLSNRNWQSTMNKVINYLLQTFRHKNFVLIFTVPYTDFIDAASRKLFHANFETIGINKSKKTCSVKPKMVQYNASMKKFYHKYLKVRKDRTRIIKVKRWAIPKPSKDLIKEYEDKKNDFTSGLNKEIEQSLNQESGNGVKIKYQHRDYYIAWHLIGGKQKDLAEILDTSFQNLSGVFKTMDKQYPEWRKNDKMLGFDIRDIKSIKNLSPTQLKFLDCAKFSHLKDKKE